MRKQFSIVILAVLVLFTTFTFNITAKAEPADNNIVSSDVLFYGSLDISPAAWIYFVQRIAPNRNSRELKEIYNFFQKQGFDLEKDILFTFNDKIITAIYPYKDKETPPFVVASLARDTVSGRNFTDKFFKLIEKESGSKASKEIYSGAEINIFNAKDKYTGIVSFYKNYVILSDSIDLMKKTIDNLDNKNPGLKGVESFSKIQDSLSKSQLYFYFNVQDILKMSKKEIEKDADFSDIARFFEIYKSFGIGVELNREGVIIKSSSIQGTTGKKSMQKLFAVPGTDFQKITSLVPSDALLFLGFNEFLYSLDAFKDIESDSINQLFVEMMRGLTDFSGVDMQKDFIPNIDNNIALFFGPRSDALEFGFFIGLKNNNKMADIMNKVKINMSGSPNPKKSESLRFKNTLKYRGINITLLNGNINEGIKPGYFIKDNMLVIGSNLNALKKIIDSNVKQSKSLTGNKTFINIKDKMGNKFNFACYLDLKSLIGIFNNLSGESNKDKFIETLSGTGYSFYNDKNRGEGYLVINIDMDKIDTQEISTTVRNMLFTDEIRKQNAPLISNMTTFQVLLDRYVYDNKAYPKDIAALKAEGIAKNYWFEIDNPYDKTKPGIVDFSFFKERDDSLGGAVVYKPVTDTKGVITGYEIMVADEYGYLINNSDGKIYILSSIKSEPMSLPQK